MSLEQFGTYFRDDVAATERTRQSSPTSGCRNESRDRNQRADRRRRAGRTDPRHRPRLARHRCHGRRSCATPASRRASSAIRSRPAPWKSSAASAWPRSCAKPGFRRTIPNDVVSATTVTGIELSRVVIPLACERYTATNGADTWWPTPEPSHRINQTYFEPVLFAHAASQPRIRILNRTEIEGFVQDEHGVTAVACNLDSGEPLSIACTYLVGCDGGKSAVRKAIGAKFAGTSEIQRVQSTYIRAPALIDLLPGKRAWMYLSLNPRRCGMTIAVDGQERWLIHNFLYHGESEFDSIDRDWAIRAILGVGPDFPLRGDIETGLDRPAPRG